MELSKEDNEGEREPHFAKRGEGAAHFQEAGLPRPERRRFEKTERFMRKRKKRPC